MMAGSFSVDDLVIRSYRREDKDAVIDLWFACDLVVPWNNPERDIERKLEVDPDLFLVAELGGKIVASCMAGYEGHRGWINYLAVAPRYRRRGIASRMMAEAERKLEAIGCPKINLQVRAQHKDVIAFYRSIGYIDDDIINMGKRLEEDEPYERS
jgi:ribosomal protein S18 acetylase RimI-like enzyme